MEKRKGLQRKKDTQSLGDIIKEVMKNNHLNRGLLENRAIHYWQMALGKPVARATSNIYIKNGVLYVQLNSSIIRSELMMFKTKIIENINHELGEEVIKDIVMR